jgi:hypothetical protein
MAVAPKRASITLNGETLTIKAGTANIQLGGLSGSPVVADDGSVHTSFEPVPCMVECTLIMVPAQAASLEATLKGLVDGTGSFNWIGGPSYVLTGVSANEAGTWAWDGDGLKCKFHANAALPGA